MIGLRGGRLRGGRLRGGRLRGGRRFVVAVALAIAALAVCGAANAYWLGTGSGSGTAGTTALAGVVLTPATPSVALAPGGTGDVALTVDNSNALAVDVRSLALDTSQGTGGFAVDALHTGCDVSVLGFAPQDNGGSGWTVPARAGGQDGSLAITLPGAVSMDASAANACQGASFTVYLRAGP